MPKTTSIVNAELDSLLDSGFIGLFTTNPTSLAGTGGTEMSGGSYARVDLSTLMGAAANRSKANDTLIQITTNTGTVTGVGVWSAISGGTLRLWQPLLQSVSLEPNTFPTTGEGADVIQLAQGQVRDVEVKNDAESVTYVEGTDYYVQYESGRVVRIGGGGISSGDAVKVSYKYPTTQATTAGVVFNLAVGALSVSDKQFS